MNTKKIDEITRDNCRVFIAALMDENKLSTRKVAKAITCSDDTLNRIIAGKTFPSELMIKQTGIMMAVGFKNYSNMKQADKEKISETIGTIGAGALGFGSITAAVSASGSIAGLSAAGIATGLGTIGGIVGGGMMAGILVAAAIPIAAGAAGYGIIKGIKALFEEQKLEDERYDPFWELPIVESIED